MPGTPYRIAAGVASGAAVSFTPFIGFHFVLAMLLSLLIRGNVIASAVGTAVGNPWTFPFIWAWTYMLGRWMLGVGDFSGIDQALTFPTFAEIFFERPAAIFWPMLLGSLPTCLVAWVAVYLPVTVMVSQYQRGRRRRLRRQLRKLKLLKRQMAAPPASQATSE